jgi:antirestriction protein ArdC
MKTDVYQRITDQIVCELEKGVRPWLKPLNAVESLNACVT